MCTRDRNSTITSSLDSTANFVVMDLVLASEHMLDFTFGIIQSFRLQKHLKERKRRAGISDDRHDGSSLKAKNRCTLWFNYDLDVKRYEDDLKSICKRTTSNLRLLRVSRLRAPRDHLDLDSATITSVDGFCRGAYKLIELMEVFDEIVNPPAKKPDVSTSTGKVKDDVTTSKMDADESQTANEGNNLIDTDNTLMDTDDEDLDYDEDTLNRSDEQARTGNYAPTSDDEDSTFESIVQGWNNNEGDSAENEDTNEEYNDNDASEDINESKVADDEPDSTDAVEGEEDADDKKSETQLGAVDSKTDSKKKKGKGNDVTLNADDLEELQSISDSFKKLCNLFTGILDHIKHNSLVNESLVLITASSSCFTELTFILSKLRKLGEAASSPMPKCIKQKQGQRSKNH
ncbi:hypothetical protein GJ496_001357 [Pomphorhynchus laevis]|nr:hypothetical protein GJ496_001357 [Pomphorhynchus laevis]